jgi:hypothetical protein
MFCWLSEGEYRHASRANTSTKTLYSDGFVLIFTDVS